MESSNNYTKYRTYALLEELAETNTASDFGRINQALLALAFQKAGFDISHYQGTGRPDFIAIKEKESYAVEVKAPPAEKVVLTIEDINGVEELGHRAILAILTYPSVDTRWLFIDTHRLSPHTYNKLEIARLSITILEERISPFFLQVMEENREKVKMGASALQSLVESKSKEQKTS